MLDSNSPLYDKKCTCHFCQTSFLTKKVRSGSQASLKRDADFCTYYKNQLFNPILYTVHVCPDCGYSFTDQFDSFLPPLVKRQLQEKLASKWTPKAYGAKRSLPEAIATYKLAIYTAQLKQEAHSVQGGLYLRLAWLNRFLENTDEEKRFINLAVAEYEESYIHSDYQTADKEMSEVRLLYLIGELMRQTGKLDQSIKYFSKVNEFRGKTMETGIIKLAQDQWSVVRQQHKESKKQIG